MAKIMNQKMAVLLVVTALAVPACDSAQTESQSQSSEQAMSPAPVSGQAETPESTAIPVKSVSSMYGYYVGDFVAVKLDEKKSPMYRNKINLSIDTIQDKSISGHSVVAGNMRPFTGTMSKAADGTYRVNAKEPGTDPYDGQFSFTLDSSNNTLRGTWQANSKNLAVTSRSYDLVKTSFKYNPDQNLRAEDLRMSTGMFESLAEVFGTQYSTQEDQQVDGISYHAERITEDAFKFNASKKLLSTHDVENMHKRDLEVMRNLIYARHGYSFQNRQMRYFFDHIKWYVPVSTDVTKDLTEIELKNIKLLKRYENYANTYYDHFGR